MLSVQSLSDPARPVGGRLMHFAPNWAAVTTDPWVLATVSRGLTIPWRTSPPHRPRLVRWVPPRTADLVQFRLMAQKIATMEHQNVVERLPGLDPVNAWTLSTMFPVPKGPDDIRPVFNLRWLNQFVEAEHFKMEDIRTVIALTEPMDWFTKVDIKDAFMHVPMHRDAQPYLAFPWEQGWFRFTTMPFGLSTAPRAFTKLLRPLMAALRARGVRVVIYIDDALILARSPAESMLHTRWLLELLAMMGFLVNWPKSSIMPTQSIEFLGFRVNSTLMQVSLPANKLASLRHRVAQALAAPPTMPLRALASIVGSLNATALAVLPSRLRTRALLRDKITALHTAGGTWTGTVSLSPEAIEELRWWRDSLERWNGRSMIPTEPELAVYTDASDTGWGAVLGTATASGFWSHAQEALHINEKELLAIELGLRSFLDKLRDRTVLLRVDNTVAVTYVNHQGGTHSPNLSRVAQRIWNLALSSGMVIEALHIPGIENTEADAASRRTLQSHEWRLHPRIFRALSTTFGPFTVDLFATVLNRQTPRYFSWGPDPETAGLDALQQPWGAELAYANPPWILIPQVLQKTRLERARLLLIAPVWPTQAWYPSLLELLVEQPVLLPTGEDLFCPDLPRAALGPPRWQAAAWPLSGNASEARGFRNAQPRWSASAAPSPHAGITIRLGAGGTAGVVNDSWIRFTLLSRRS